uniref:Thrombospondin, type I, domain containing 7Aa n=1 Tax=Oryzias sinensis TaxID=183150 RepID=A0A8C8DTX3_9TELE
MAVKLSVVCLMASIVCFLGPWGRCMGSECGPGGSQSRAVWCSHPDGWTTLHTNCDQAGRPDNQQGCFRVCDWHKDLYGWQLGAWNQCVPVAMRNGGGQRPAVCSRGEEGIQTREVGCVQKADGEPAEDAICEYFEPRPRQEQACLIPCPRDCVVSEFTPWTLCSKTCGMGLRNRVRNVLAPPLFGGSACPNLTEFQTCQVGPCEGEESLYSLRVGPWGPCSRKEVKERLRERGKVKDPETRELMKKRRNKNRQNRPGGKFWDLQVGYQTREVSCQHKSGNMEALSMCSQEMLPVTFQACVVPRDCDVTEWSEWSACSKECYDPNTPGGGQRTRTRRVSQFPLSGGAECPELEESEPCSPQADTAPTCTLNTWKTTEWTECRVDALLSQQDRRRGNQTGLCGGGIQTREVYCVQAGAEMPLNLRTKEALRPVDSELCQGIPPNTTQLCHINCPVECEVSPWSAWGPCTFENCQDQATKKGFKLRKRRIINEPTGGMGNCPHLVEAIPCDDPSCFEWLVVKLEECVPDNDRECGPGTQIPQVQCVNSEGEETQRRELCRDAILPMPTICEVPCPKDCALSPWTQWSPCSHTCSGKNAEGKQTRVRSILAYNAGEGGVQCPNASALQEVRICNDHPCTVYHWQTGPWGQCIEDSSFPYTNVSVGVTRTDDGSCAVGMQTRKVICVRVNVGQVPPKKCPESLRPDTVRPCLLPCRKDCIVSPYSEWSPCPSTCGNSKKKQVRKRIIIQVPANGGQDCPEVLVQERDCEARSVCPGYRWKTHKWRRCQLVPWSVRQDSPGAQETCGPGLQFRAISCRKQDGGQADIEACLKSASPMPPLTQQCHLPCQEDCQLSSWSKFSSCTANCVGVRTRKRSLMGKSKKRDQCKNNQKYPLSETQYCPCKKYNAQPVGNWSDCILPDNSRVEGQLGMKVQGDVKECGQGYRYQAMACYDQDSRLVETSRCNSHGYIEEACIIPCPSDCKLSEWSNWSRCSKSCGSGVKVRSKWLREKPYNGGRPCPKLDHVNQVYEVVPCLSDCGQYVWVAEPWSVWKISNVDLRSNCGEGVQTRKIRCMLNTIDGPSEQVEDYLCDPEEMPLGARNSQLPCPGDCVLSDWGSWSPCPLPCSENRTRERTAFPLRQPGNNKTCPPTTATEPCKMNSNCVSQQTGLQMNASCVVECPVNCQLSDWSAWSECTRSCGLAGTFFGMKSAVVLEPPLPSDSLIVKFNTPLSRFCSALVSYYALGKLWRRRTVVQAPQGDGRPWGQCFEYKWRSGPWRGSSRQVWCERSDGLNVTGGCLQSSKPMADRSCHPPCTKPRSFCTEAGVCGCEEGFTEVMTSDGLLDQCTVIPMLEIPTTGDNRADVKTIRGFNPTQPAASAPGRAGRTWFLQPFGPDGKLKTWVYGVAAGVFVLLVFIISMTYLRALM